MNKLEICKRDEDKYTESFSKSVSAALMMSVVIFSHHDKCIWKGSREAN